MKTQNKLLLALAFIFVISTSMFAGKTKEKIIKMGSNSMLSIGGGTNAGGTSNGVLRFDANMYVPVYSTPFMSIGFNAGGNYNSFNNDSQTLPKVYNLANQITNTAAFVGDLAAKSSGFTLQVGPQANFNLGNHLIISPILGLGLSNLYQAREYKAVQTTDMGTKSYTYDLLKVKQTAPSGLCMTPKVRLNYMISPTVGFWTEGSYTISPSVSTETSTFHPEGAVNQKGYYEERQLAFGTYTSQTLSQSYNAVGVNAGITIVLGGGSSVRKGINEGGLKKTEEIEAFRKGWDGTVKGGSIEAKGITESGIKKTDDSTTPKNKTQAEVKSIAETLVNLCIPDWGGSVKGVAQTQAEVKSIAETLVNVCKPDWNGSVKDSTIQGKGITENGIKLTEETAEFRKGWDGSVKGSNIQGKGITESGIKRSDGSATPVNKTQAEVKSIAETLVNLCIPDWGGSVKGVAQTQAEVKSIAETLVNLSKSDWDGSEEGSGIQGKGITENGIKKTDETAERKGWDGSVKGSSIQGKGITQSGIKRTEERMVDSNITDVSNVGSLTGNGGGAAAASYAATGRMASGYKDGVSDPDGVTYTRIDNNQILINGIDVNGNPFQHIMNAKEQSPLYQSSNTEHMSPLYKANAKMANSGCGSVTQKTTYPDGKVEELIFACPADAAEYQHLKNGSVPNQTPDSTSGYIKGWDGSVKGSSKGINEKGKK